ncbi:MAG: hypothetical protein R6V58_12060, partial [Planctomycetota bacterium]
MITTRELWQQIMHYGEFDRMPVVHWTEWPETRERWYDEGLPRDIDDRGGIRRYLDAVPHWVTVGVEIDLFPPFEEEVIEETDEYRVFRDSVGVIKKDWKHRSCIPQHTGFTCHRNSGLVVIPFFVVHVLINSRIVPATYDVVRL